MTSLHFATETVVAAAPAKLWEVMSDYGTAWKWMDLKEDEYVVSAGSAVGSTRTMAHMPETLVEIVRKNDAETMSFSYELTEGVAQYNMSKYVPTFQVVPEGSGSKVLYSVDLVVVNPGEGMPKDGEPPFATADGLKAMIVGMYAGWVNNAAKLAM